MEGVSLLEILIWEGLSLLEILIWLHNKGMWLQLYRICPIRIDIIYEETGVSGENHRPAVSH
jgi:hypothetical protein